jgi:hypothetical protein
LLAVKIRCKLGYSERKVWTVIGRIIPLVIAALLMAAHFLRAGDWGLVVVSLLVPLLLLRRRRSALSLVQALACFGAGVWGYTTLRLVEARIAAGMPWERMALILIGVALFTLWAALLLGSEKVRQEYREDKGGEE